MRISIALSSSRSWASLSGGVSIPISGPLPPFCDVVKNVGSTSAKSLSSLILCMRTEPTIPRQPINPTRFIDPLCLCSLHVCQHRVSHLHGSDLLHSFFVNILRPVALRQNFLHGALIACC